MIALVAAALAGPAVEGVAGVEAAPRQIYAFAAAAPVFRVGEGAAIVPRATGSWLGYEADTEAGLVRVRSPGGGAAFAVRGDVGPVTLSAGLGAEARATTRSVDGVSTEELEIGPLGTADLWWSLPKAAVFAFGSYSAATGWAWGRVGGQVDVARLGEARLRLAADVTVQGNDDIASFGGGLGLALGWERPQASVAARGGVAAERNADGSVGVRPSFGGTVWGRSAPIADARAADAPAPDAPAPNAPAPDVPGADNPRAP